VGSIAILFEQSIKNNKRVIEPAGPSSAEEL
jgi:hypothetical protein